MTPRTLILSALLLLVILAETACGTRQAARPSNDDDDQGNASAGLTQVQPNSGVQAAFTARSYAPGTLATLDLHGSATTVKVRLYRAGAGGDGTLQGAPVTAERTERVAASLPIRLGNWPSGLYYARIVTPGRGAWDAPFVLRAARLGTNRIAVVLPTNTWQAYNDEDNDSWYFDSSVTRVGLSRPFLDAGVPPHYHGYDRGFIRWLTINDVSLDFLSDDDLDTLTGKQLARAYDLVIFPGHTEYVTSHEFDTTERYRDLGGNLAFLSANDFFYKIEKHGETMVGRWRWRDLGRPEAVLVGEQYVDWNHNRYPNRPYQVTGAAKAAWLFRGTGLRNGTTFGVYGIEVDAVAASSPPHTAVLAQIPDIFGPGESAEMTYYTSPSGAKVFSAGVMNFGGSALWPQVRTMMANIIEHLRVA